MLALTVGSAAGARAEGRAPFPLASLDPLTGADEVLVPGTSRVPDVPDALGDLPAWQVLNWRINSDLTTELQNEEQVAINPLDPDNLVAVWRDFRLGHRRVGVGYTFDGGITWHDSLVEEPSYPRHSDPGIATDADGNFYVVILSYTGSTSQPNGLFVLKSEDGGVTWGDAVPAVDQVPGVFEDKELIACDRSGSLFRWQPVRRLGEIRVGNGDHECDIARRRRELRERCQRQRRERRPVAVSGRRARRHVLRRVGELLALRDPH